MEIQQHRWFWVVLLGIVLLSTIIRLSVLDHHLPDIIVEDEGSDLSRTTRLFYGEVSGFPLRYHRMLITYNNIIPLGILGVYHFIVGDVRSVSDFSSLYLGNRAEFTYATRLWMTFLISISILTVGLAGRYVNPATGIFAALTLTLNSFYTMNALYALPDALVSFATALAIWLIVRMYRFRRSRDYVLAAFSLAIVMLSKLQAAPIGLAFLVAHSLIVYEQNKGQWKKIILHYFWNKHFVLAAVTGIVGNFILNPFAFLAPELVIREFSISTSNFYGNDFTLSQYLNLYLANITRMIETIWCWALIPSLIGLVVIFVQRKAVQWVVLSGFIILFIVILNSQITPLSQIYYWMPWIIPMSIVAGLGMAELWCIAMQPKKIYRLVLVLMMMVISLDTMSLSHLISVLRQPLTQYLAQQFIHENIPPNSRIITGDPIVYGVPLLRNEESMNRAAALNGNLLNQWTYQLNLPVDQQPTHIYNLYGPEIALTVDSYEDLQALIETEAIEYYVVADYCLPQDDASSNSAKAFPPVNEDFVADWQLLAAFQPYASGECVGAIATRTGLALPPALYQQRYGGPRIRIYRITAD